MALEFPTGSVAQLLRASAEVLGSNPTECQIFSLFRRFLSSMLPRRSVGRRNFDRSLHATSDMVESHNEETMDIISNMSSNNRLHISQLLPMKATPGTFYTLPKLHKLSHLISTNANRHMTDDNLINTTQLIDKATNLSIGPPCSIFEKDTY